MKAMKGHRLVTLILGAGCGAYLIATMLQEENLGLVLLVCFLWGIIWAMINNTIWDNIDEKD